MLFIIKEPSKHTCGLKKFDVDRFHIIVILEYSFTYIPHKHLVFMIFGTSEGTIYSGYASTYTHSYSATCSYSHSCRS